jgi:hypothetical protein
MDKSPVGKRLMLLALEHAYGMADAGTSTGPLPATATAAGGFITLMFTQETLTASAGLLLRTSGSVRQTCVAGQKQISGNPQGFTVPLSQCGPATGFEVSSAATEGVWFPVQEIKLGQTGNEVMMPIPDGVGSTPTRIRYLFADWPSPTVYSAKSYLGLNGELPTPPFEMDVKVALL